MKNTENSHGITIYCEACTGHYPAYEMSNTPGICKECYDLGTWLNLNIIDTNEIIIQDTSL